jgi:uncharacterized protein involved in exopolysaccharide biosynthesis
MFRYDASPADARATVQARPEGFGITDVFLALWRRKLPIAALGLAFAGLAAAYSTTLPDQYQSTAQILIDPRELRVIANDVSPNSLNSDSITAYIESQARIITSTNTLRKIVDRENLTRDTDYVGLTSVLSRLVPIGRSRDDAGAICGSGAANEPSSSTFRSSPARRTSPRA